MGIYKSPLTTSEIHTGMHWRGSTKQPFSSFRSLGKTPAGPGSPMSMRCERLVLGRHSDILRRALGSSGFG